MLIAMMQPDVGAEDRGAAAPVSGPRSGEEDEAELYGVSGQTRPRMDSLNANVGWTKEDEA